jgi:uncharacterized membrane protein YgdD (TMEM256/DUF423 family)
MSLQPPLIPQKVSALVGALGVALGAFGAHGLKSILVANEALSTWQTASQYHLLHAVVLLCLSWRKNPPPAAFWLLAAGLTLFSGSLYVLALTGIRALGAVTPVGGLLLILGWLLLARSPALSDRSPA